MTTHPSEPARLTLPEPQKPHRRFELEIHVGADDWETVLRELQRLTAHLEEHGPACDSVSGGYDQGSWVKIVERPDQTHDKYVAELEAYLASERSAGGQR